MKYLTNLLLVGGLVVLAQGAVAFFLRFNFITGTRYGPSLTPLYLVFAGIAILVVWLILRTITRAIGTSKKKDDG